MKTPAYSRSVLPALRANASQARRSMAPTRAATAVVIMIARMVTSGRHSMWPTVTTSAGDTVFDRSSRTAPAVVATAGPMRRRTPMRGRVTDRVTASANVEQAKMVCTREVPRTCYLAAAGFVSAGFAAGGAGGFKVTRHGLPSSRVQSPR